MLKCWCAVRTAYHWYVCLFVGEQVIYFVSYWSFLFLVWSTNLLWLQTLPTATSRFQRAWCSLQLPTVPTSTSTSLCFRTCYQKQRHVHNSRSQFLYSQHNFCVSQMTVKVNLLGSMITTKLFACKDDPRRDIRLTSAEGCLWWTWMRIEQLTLESFLDHCSQWCSLDPSRNFDRLNSWTEDSKSCVIQNWWRMICCATHGKLGCELNTWPPRYKSGAFSGSLRPLMSFKT